jgi:hypothetical protein
LGDLNIDGRLYKNSSGSGQGPVEVFCEYGKETSGLTKDGEILDHLSHCYLFKKRTLQK